MNMGLSFFLDEQPYEERDPDDEQTWSAMYKIAAEQIRPKVEEWKSFMDVSLVFVRRRCPDLDDSLYSRRTSICRLPSSWLF